MQDVSGGEFGEFRPWIPPSPPSKKVSFHSLQGEEPAINRVMGYSKGWFNTVEQTPFATFPTHPNTS